MLWASVGLASGRGGESMPEEQEGREAKALLLWLEGRVKGLAKSLEGTDEGATVAGILLDLEDVRAGRSKI